MKLETLAYDNIKKVLPKGALKTVVYANISDTSYEIFFYSLFPGQGYKQCYELAVGSSAAALNFSICFNKSGNFVNYFVINAALLQGIF